MISDAAQIQHSQEDVSPGAEGAKGSNMTLCIATASRHNGNPAYSLCSDTRSLSGARAWGIVSICSENANKSRYFPECDRWAAVIAGDPTDGDELITLCDPYIRTFAVYSDDDQDFDIHINQLFEGLRSAARTRLKQIQDHFIATNSPFHGYGDFLARGKASLPEIQYRELWHDIASLTLNTEVIIGGIHDDEAILIKIDNKGNPHWEDQYSVIGTGAAEALAFLAQNEYDESEIRLEDSLMRMVEALHFVSTANNTVGHASRFEVHLSDGSERDLRDDFFQKMKSKIRMLKAVDLGDCGDFLDSADKEVSSSGEQQKASSDSGVPSPEHPRGSGSGGASGGDSTTPSGVPGDGSEQS